MGKMVFLAMMGGLIYVGMEIYDEGARNAFGGAFAFLAAGDDLPEQDLRAGGREAGQAVMLGNPVAFVAQLLDEARELDRLAQSRSGRATLAHRHLVHDTEPQTMLLARHGSRLRPLSPPSER